MRKIAEGADASKSSVHRHLKSILNRRRYPESAFWETEEGAAFQRRLVSAVLYDFGLTCNAGADRLSDFFRRIRADTHVGVSPAALRNQLNRMQELLPEFQKTYEKQNAGTPRKAVAAGDETFFNEMLIPVLTDLSSGCLPAEEMANDRKYETWQETAEERLREPGIEVDRSITDRGRVLIKLATEAFGREPGADLFHEQNGIAKRPGPVFHRRLRRTRTEAAESEAKLKALTDKGAEKYKTDKQKQRVERDKETCEKARESLETCRETLREISEAAHPFSPEDDTPRDSARTEDELREKARKFEETARLRAIRDRRGVMNKFRKNLKDLSSRADWRRPAVLTCLTDQAAGDDRRDRLIHAMLPAVYRHKQMEKSQSPHHTKKHKQAWMRALAAREAHPLTPAISSDELKKREARADAMAGQFHRSSSAAEGRNGCLPQMYHNGRGLSAKRLKALAVIHNFGLKRLDGTAAAERLSGVKPPDLFDWIAGQMGDLPLPRKRRERVVSNPLNFNFVPA